MKAVTHDIFSLGLGLYLACQIGRLPILPSLVLVFWLTVSINKLIDILGHRSKDGYAVRSYWTHSVFTAPIWGISVALGSVYLYDFLVGQQTSLSQAIIAVGLGATLAYSHLLLDALTEGGIFFGRRRIALAHMRYDNPILNGLFVISGLSLVLAALV